jgi:uncharacterized protein
MPAPRSKLIFVIIFLAVLTSGCSSIRTKNEFYKPIVADLKNNDYQSAVVKMETAKNSYTKKDRLLYYLDVGLAYHYAGLYDSSNLRLSDAERSAEELYTKSVSRAVASMFLNDNTLEYSGEDYEVLYSNIFMALNYISLNKFDDAFVEVRRANEKLSLLEQKYAKAAKEFNSDTSKVVKEGHIRYEPKKIRFNNDAFARYLSMHMYAADGKYDDARIDYEYLEQAFATQPRIYNFAMPKVRFDSKTGAVLSVVAMAGLAPYKKEVSLRLRTDKQLNLVQIMYEGTNQEYPEYGHFLMPVDKDFYFKFSLPVMKRQVSRIGRIEVVANGNLIGELSLIEDVSNVAQETFEVKKTLIYFKSILRALAKGLAAHKTKEDVEGNDFGSWLTKAFVDAVVEASEAADLRCTHLLPGKIFVRDFEVDPGIYDVTVKFISTDGLVVYTKHYPGYKVFEGDFNLIEAYSLN